MTGETRTLVLRILLGVQASLLALVSLGIGAAALAARAVTYGSGASASVWYLLLAVLALAAGSVALAWWPRRLAIALLEAVVAAGVLALDPDRGRSPARLLLLCAGILVVVCYPTKDTAAP